MAETDISICSRVLVLLGAQPISAFTEGDTGTICGAAYPALKMQLFSKYGWRFLMTKKNLTKDASAPIGEWANSFIIPGEALSVPQAIFSSSNGVIGERDYEVFGRRIYTNFETVLMDFTEAKPESEWPPYFVALMDAALAARIAFAVTDQQNVAESWKQIAFGPPGDDGLGGLMSDGMSLDSQSGGNQGIQSDAFTDARFGTNSFTGGY